MSSNDAVYYGFEMRRNAPEEQIPKFMIVHRGKGCLLESIPTEETKIVHIYEIQIGKERCRTEPVEDGETTFRLDKNYSSTRARFEFKNDSKGYSKMAKKIFTKVHTKFVPGCRTTGERVTLREDIFIGDHFEKCPLGGAEYPQFLARGFGYESGRRGSGIRWRKLANRKAGVFSSRDFGARWHRKEIVSAASEALNKQLPSDLVYKIIEEFASLRESK